ncbi:hypothetical protein E2C01_074685 [Portunus trituberculatus]|uniref:Uncharacterized protein n=1 Tax=Portunus trituberculatus TaxID=210409 RepID=A0A5B7IGX3_PORTR|nr:hypothetical protein [Portunus trituberculatus]
MDGFLFRRLNIVSMGEGGQHEEVRIVQSHARLLAERI